LPQLRPRLDILRKTQQLLGIHVGLSSEELFRTDEKKLPDILREFRRRYNCRARNADWMSSTERAVAELSKQVEEEKALWDPRMDPKPRPSETEPDHARPSQTEPDRARPSQNEPD